MTFEIIKGDLIQEAVEGRAKTIVHGCNCFHAMGSGIAGALARRFPEIPKADQEKHTKGRVASLANYTKAEVTYELRSKPYNAQKSPDDTVERLELENPFTCINLYTQYHPGADFLPSLFPEALKRLNRDFKGETLWFPMIGCGIGGGDWAQVMNMMLNHLTDVNFKVVVYA